MAALTVQKVVNAGTKPNFALNTPTASDTAHVGDGTNTFLVYRNTDSNAKTITIDVSGTTDYGQPNPDPTYTLPATTGELWIPLRTQYRNENGVATVALTGTGGVTGVTVALVRVE